MVECTSLSAMFDLSSPINGAVFSFPLFRGNCYSGRSKPRKIARIASVLADFSKDLKKLHDPFILRKQADPKTVVSIILGGGEGKRLFPLTQKRAKPAVPIGGCYRLIDIPMSNCINSGINKVYILTQFNSQSLNRHISTTYNLGSGVPSGDGFVEILAATQTPSGNDWFRGTADAVRQFLWLFEDSKHGNIENILILPGDHLCRMDYLEFLQKHIQSEADVSVSCQPVKENRASDYASVKVDESGRITQFDDQGSLKVNTSSLGLSENFPCIASMGIYFFKTEVLLDLLKRRWPSANDFAEVIPLAAGEYSVQAQVFDGYWEDLKTIKSFLEANLALTDEPPKFHFFDTRKPIYTSPQFLPPTEIENSRVSNSIISHGCFLRDCEVDRSVIGIRSRLNYGVVLKNTMMMGADYYQTEEEITASFSEGRVPVGVGDGTKIKNCIIDKNAMIGRNVMISNVDGVLEADRPSDGFYIRSGVVVVTKNAVIKDGTVI